MKPRVLTFKLIRTGNYLIYFVMQKVLLLQRGYSCANSKFSLRKRSFLNKQGILQNLISQCYAMTMWSAHSTKVIFRCYQGCANIDHRWALDSADSGKNLAIFSQIKYSDRTATTELSTPDIRRWYDTTMKSVKNYE